MSAASNDPIATRYASANASLDDVIGRVPPDGWSAASPCEGWTALDVLTHMRDSQRSFLVDRGLDLGAERDLASDPVAGWRQHSAAVQSRLDDPEVVSTEYDGYFGRTTIGETIARFHLFDMYVHRWDIATATGVGTQFSDSEMDEIEAAADSLGDNIYRPGVCADAVTVPDGAGRQAALLARLGRVDQP
jgi:uncharacterized protein (TIGR03086 family)